jgi:hypothetical protein
MNPRIKKIVEVLLLKRIFVTIQSIRSRNYKKQPLREWGVYESTVDVEVEYGAQFWMGLTAQFAWRQRQRSEFLKSENRGRNHVPQRIDEKIGLLAAIESERHFFEVGRKILRADMVPRATNPALKLQFSFSCVQEGCWIVGSSTDGCHLAYRGCAKLRHVRATHR